MGSMATRPEGALLVGGVALPTAEDVFRTAASILGDRLRAIPDGETGPRLQWILWQLPIIQDTPGIELVPCPPAMYGPWDRLRLAADQDPDELAFGELGYAHVARRSYAVFERLKRAGEIPAHCRFQVSLPTPLAPVTVLVVPESHQLIEPAYERALLRELDAICDAIPHDQLAIQWDVCWEIAFLEGLLPAPWEGGVTEGVLDRLARICARVPDAVELGLHLCYGDYRHEHFKEPTDTALVVDLLAGARNAIERSVQWVHLPVPIDRDDADYFAPLHELEPAPETDVYLGLVHMADGVAGARRRIAAASSALDRFGIACECGMARRPPRQIPDLMRIHREACAPLAAPVR